MGLLSLPLLLLLVLLLLLLVVLLLLLVLPPEGRRGHDAVDVGAGVFRCR